MRASRLLSLLLLLQNRGRMTAPALAAELEVSVRTVYRDGGYQLLDGYRTRLTGLTSDEADSLFLAGVPGPAAELGLGGALAAAQLKLTAALPAELRDRASRVGERFHLDAPGWFRDAEDTPFLSDLATALWRDQRIAVRYRRWGHDEVDRLLDPLGLVLKAGVWYLVAGGPTGAPRTYRVSRVLSLRTSPGRTHRPPDFSLAEFWRTRSAELRAALWRAEATVRLSPRGLELVPMLLGQLEARAVAESAGVPAGDGWVTATLPIESTRHAESVLLRLGADVEVLAPPELRERLAAVARALVARYGSS
jgi:predicted DNA-binding transcriptional regulator YafY